MNEKLILEKLTKNLKAFFKTAGAKKAVLGLSGGLDSAVAAVIAARALGPKNVYAVALPTKYNSPKSMVAARKLAKNLGINFKVINIEPLFKSARSALGPRVRPLTTQNLQPRLRAVVLMAASAEENALLLACSNKSEIYAGYCTLYGDSCGAIAPLGALYKTEVYALSAHINKNKEVIPNFIITRPPSAELAPAQKDCDDLPPYEILDGVYRCIIDEGKSEKQAAARTGASLKTVKELMLRKKKNEFKRAQSAPVLKI